MLKQLVLALFVISLSSSGLSRMAFDSLVWAQSASALTPQKMSIQTCPGFPAASTTSATEVTVQIPSDAPDSGGSLQAWGSPPTVLVGPADFSCITFAFLADGGLSMVLAGPDDSCYSQSGYACLPDYLPGPISATQRIAAVFSPGGAGPNFALACPYFPSVQAQALAAQGPDCRQSLPPDEVVQQLDANTVAFYEPAPDAGTSPTFGLVLSGPGSAKATCTLRASDSSICRSVLTAFLTGYGQSYDPSADSAATSFDLLAWFASGP